ncbi:MAG: response regulator [Desulfobacter sp.]|nr:MAG: response regulator [Desulfobacter sp.]
MRLIYLLLTVFFLMSTSPCPARDFMVTFVEENYKETEVPFSHRPKIYHTLQVRSDAGPKLLILSGDSQEYRKWLRQYISRDKRFMVQVPDEKNDDFVGSRVFKIEVTRVHPFNGKKWTPGTGEQKGTKTKEKPKQIRTIFGNQNVMVIDRNMKRSGLIASVITRMGYNAMVSRDGGQALEVFKVQPEKFKMIITNHDIQGMAADQFIDNLLKIDYQIPILVETGYNNDPLKERFLSKFSGAGSVTIKPVVLDDLQKTINQLVKPVKVNG